MSATDCEAIEGRTECPTPATCLVGVITKCCAERNPRPRRLCDEHIREAMSSHLSCALCNAPLDLTEPIGLRVSA